MKILVLNGSPRRNGSCGKQRFDQEISFAMMKIEDGMWSVEKIVLPNA